MKRGVGKFCVIILSGFLFLLLLTGCALVTSLRQPEPGSYQPFIPPTIAPTPLPTQTPSLAPSGPEEEIEEGSSEFSDLSDTECRDNLTFISDITIPDGTVVVAGSTLDKQWEVENSGTCNWEEGYQIQLITGEDLGAEPEQGLIPARSGSRVTIRIVFAAPDEPGNYRSAWQAYNPQGNAFGDPFYIDITVE